MEIAPRQQHSMDSACSKDMFERKCETLNSDFFFFCERKPGLGYNIRNAPTSTILQPFRVL